MSIGSREEMRKVLLDMLSEPKTSPDIVAELSRKYGVPPDPGLLFGTLRELRESGEVEFRDKSKRVFYPDGSSYLLGIFTKRSS